MTSARRIGAIAIAAAAVLVVVLVVNRGSDSTGKVSAGRSTTTTAAGRAGTGDGEQAAADTSATGAGGPGTAAGSTEGGQTSAAIPLTVTASNTQGLKDGDAVALRVVPKKGAVIYGFEAFLCRGGTSYRFDADVRPTLTGKCVSQPLSSRSQDYMEVRASPPYQSARASFRVGTGTDTYKIGDGRTAAVSCGPGHPCTLVLKLQFENDFGFQTVPLVYG